jgi:hypothetical protein
MLGVFRKKILSVVAVVAIVATTLAVAVPVSAATAPYGSMTPSTPITNLGNGATFTVTLGADVGTHTIRAWQANLNFDPTKLEVVGVVTEGTMLSGWASSHGATSAVAMAATIDNVGGHVNNMSYYLQGGVGGPTGTGTLSTIQFHAKTNDTTAVITVSNNLFSDVNGDDVTPLATNSLNLTIGNVPSPDLAPINVVANGTTSNYTVSFNVQNLGTVASVATTANIFVDGSAIAATTVTVPAVAASSTSALLTSSTLTISGTLDSIVVTVVPVTGETNTSNNSSAPVNYIYQAAPSGNPVIVDGNIGLTFDFTPPSAIAFGTMHVGDNVQTDTHMKVTSNEAWQITVQGLAPTTTGGTDGKMTKWLPTPAPSGTYYPAVKLHAPLQISANTPTSSGTVALDGTVQTLGSGTPETQHIDGSGLTMSTIFTQNMSYTDYALTNGYNYHIVVNFICTPTLY